MHPGPLWIWLDRLDEASEATQFGSLGHDRSRGTCFRHNRSSFERNAKDEAPFGRALGYTCTFRGLRHPSTQLSAQKTANRQQNRWFARKRLLSRSKTDIQRF